MRDGIVSDCYIRVFLNGFVELQGAYLTNLSGIMSRLLFLFLLFVPSMFAASTPAPQVALSVDATEASRKIFHATMTIPAQPGTLTLYYPKWIPGEHGPT